MGPAASRSAARSASVCRRHVALKSVVFCSAASSRCKFAPYTASLSSPVPSHFRYTHSSAAIGGVAVGVGVSVGVAVAVSVGVGVGVSVDVGVAVSVGVAVVVGVSVGVAVLLGVALGSGEGVAVAVAVTVGVGVGAGANGLRVPGSQAVPASPASTRRLPNTQ